MPAATEASTGNHTAAAGIPRECKRLAEVDFPIAVVSRHAVREKSIRQGHPSTLHLWWARRPLASSRAVLLALLLPDPCDGRCPEPFKQQARQILGAVRQPPKNDAELRKTLLWFIGAFANWDMAAHPTYLEVGRSLVRAAHGKEPPLVVDPFAGGGSISLEALRLDCEAFASDLNPVACLILKVMLENIPRHGPGLGDELRRLGAEIKATAEKELTDLYPADADGATPIAYLWARTVRCEAPNCGAEIPLMRSFWLCKKTTRKRALRYQVNRTGGETPRLKFEVFEPRADQEVPRGTVKGARATCLCCRSVLPAERTRAQLAALSGGASPIYDDHGRRVAGAMMIAVVSRKLGRVGREYRIARAEDERRFALAARRPLRDPPEEEINPIRPSPNARGLSAVTRYGIASFADLYNRRQIESLLTFARLVSEQRPGPLKELLALVVGRIANAWTSLCRWHESGEKIEGAFSGQKVAMVWDFAEATPFSGATGAWDGAVDWIATFIERSLPASRTAQVQQADAASELLPHGCAAVWFTDPPYYDSVPYADLADFFLVWLRRALPELPASDPHVPRNSLSPKVQECVWNQAHQDEDGRSKTPAFFERKFSCAAEVGRRTLSEDGVACVVFAHKSTKGWEALLGGLTAGGLTITASWPVATEMAQRTNARNTASLMGSVHLICRPRPADAKIGDWADILRELPQQVRERMESLQAEGIRGADLLFACIGPALELFSRYKGVEMADGSPVGLEEFLERVWEVVGRAALENVLGAAEAKAHNGLAGALEEDARLTALFLWTLQATSDENSEKQEQEAGDDAEANDQEAAGTKAKGFSLGFDVVRRFAQPLGIDLPKWENWTIETTKGVIRLLPVGERAKQLFGDQGAQAVAAWLEKGGVSSPDARQGVLFPNEQEKTVAVRERRPRYGETDESGDERSADSRGATTLDHVHTAMLLQASGQTNALHALVRAERERGPDFMRLSNALSALYPRGSEEKRLIDAMLLAAPSR